MLSRFVCVAYLTHRPEMVPSLLWNPRHAVYLLSVVMLSVLAQLAFAPMHMQ